MTAPLTTVPAELAAAAAQLTAIINSLTAENAGAAAATTVIAPAAADPVSIQQAAIFSAYGTHYQQLAAGAQTIQEQYAQNLQQGSTTYTSTEATNAANNALQQASSNSDPSLLGGLYTFLNDNSLFGPSGGLTTISMDEAGNFASAYSDVIGMGGGGLLTSIAAPAGGDLAGLAGATDLAGTTGPAVGSGMAGMGAMPVAAGLGQATMVGKLSVPPSWAGTFTSPASPATAIETVGWTGAAPQAGPGTIIPGMPGMGAAARNSAGFGAPRYGVKPIVMPKPAAV